MEKSERLKFVMQRIDHYYNGVNYKGTFFLGVNTFTLGGCLAAYQSLTSGEEGAFWLGFSFVITALFSLLSIGSVLWAILPYLNHGTSYDYESIIFFGAIANKDFKKFKDEIEQVKPEGFEEDMTRQVHILSKGLKKKFIFIRNAGILLFLSMLSAIPFFYQIIELKS